MIYKRIVIYGTDKHRTSKITRKFAQGINDSGTNYIYLAFAKSPFKPANAR